MSEKCPNCFNAEQDAELLAMSNTTLKERIAELEKTVDELRQAQGRQSNDDYRRGFRDATAAANVILSRREEGSL